MAFAYPEGEVFFRRSVLDLKKNSIHYDASKLDIFYLHVLIEYVKNYPSYAAFGAKHTRSDLVPHKRGNKTYYTWRHIQVMRGQKDGTIDHCDKIPIGAHGIMDAAELEARHNGGPIKVGITPVPMGNKSQPILYIDATAPIRALYFPLAQSADEDNPDISTYLQINFTQMERRNVWLWLRDENKWHLDRDAKFSDQRLGFYQYNWTICVDVKKVYEILALPRNLRAESIWSSRAIYMTREWQLSHSGHTTHDYRQHWFWDFAHIVNSSFGVELAWKPFTEVAKKTSFIWNVLKGLSSAILGLIPYAGPLLSMAFNLGMAAMLDPEAFRKSAVNGELVGTMIEMVIGTAAGIKGNMRGGYKVNSSSKSRGAIGGNPEFLLLQTGDGGQAGRLMLEDEPVSEDNKADAVIKVQEDPPPSPFLLMQLRLLEMNLPSTAPEIGGNKDEAFLRGKPTLEEYQARWKLWNPEQPSEVKEWPADNMEKPVEVTEKPTEVSGKHTEADKTEEKEK